MTHCDSSVPTVGHSFFEALLPLVIIRTSPSSFDIMFSYLVTAGHRRGRGGCGGCGGDGAGLVGDGYDWVHSVVGGD